MLRSICLRKDDMCLAIVTISFFDFILQKFLCNGRLVFGPDAKSLLVTLLLILVPVVIFCTNVARNLVHEVSAYNAGYAILVVAILLTVYVLLLLFLTSAQDPGIVPRNLHPPEEEVADEVKYCDTCKLYRPPRCSHCSVCDNCVERFDHHCPWVGQCIGVRNYRYFFLFVSSSALLCGFVVAMSALNIKLQMDNYGTLWKGIKATPASVILVAYSFFFLWFVGGLTCFHLYLISTNQTTYENFRYRGDDRIRVYDKGCLKNFLQVFCSKIKPAIKFHAYVQENEQRPSNGLNTPEAEARYSGGDPRVKVEDDREIGGDLLKISQRRDDAEV
ncbi:hypothetical protein Patl1_27659 [Pistacia atlantica]|uniref:Uncharacterized protein n=1 Tax=Pistacia atlantica TaxID=434234 RepID=A0ACC1BDC0_9ROSI|nr:hypothetical protein Patl1_27659 [Pistacia atlantica]